MATKSSLWWSGLLGLSVLVALSASVLFVRYRRAVVSSAGIHVQHSPSLSGADVADLLGMSVLRFEVKALKGETIVMGYVQGNERRRIGLTVVESDFTSDILLAYRSGGGNEAILSYKYLGGRPSLPGKLVEQKGHLKFRLPIERAASVVSMNLKRVDEEIIGFRLQSEEGESVLVGLWIEKSPN